MTMSTLNLNVMLEQAIQLSRDHDDWSSEQIISQLMSNQSVVMDVPPIKAKEVKKVQVEKADKVERTRAAPAKPRAIPEGDTRCCARSFYEKEHLEGSSLKVMRDDIENLYGDRCKFKKSGDTEFCKHHSEKQPLGIWGGEYFGKFKAHVERHESGSAPAPKKEKKEKPAKVEVVAPVESEHEEEEVEEDEEDEEEPEIDMSPPKPTKATAAAAAEEVAEVEEVVIDGKEYLKDEEGIVYDLLTEDPVGKYDFAKKCWISK
jgi:hypothetical protein